MADAPSLSTSTRWMAPAGMLFRSTPALSPGEAKLASRRPFSSTSVDDTPMPRRLAPLKPRWPEVPSVMLAPSDSGAVLALMFLSSSAAVVTPDLSMSSRLMTCTGSAVSASTRLIDEPVISTRGIGAALCAWAAQMAEAPRPAASASRMEQDNTFALGIAPPVSRCRLISTPLDF